MIPKNWISNPPTSHLAKRFEGRGDGHGECLFLKKQNLEINLANTYIIVFLALSVHIYYPAEKQQNKVWNRFKKLTMTAKQRRWTTLVCCHCQLWTYFTHCSTVSPIKLNYHNFPQNSSLSTPHHQETA